MTKKHFIKIAAAFKARLDHIREDDTRFTEANLKYLARDLCDTFKDDNPAFDKARFMTACGF